MGGQVSYFNALKNIPEIKPTINTINFRNTLGISTFQNSKFILPLSIFRTPNITTITINIIPIIFF